MEEEPASKKAKVDDAMTLTYFPVMAKGLGPAIVAEMSGLPWRGNNDTGFETTKWGPLKQSGKCPFGQLPLLEVNGFNIGQSTAIVNYIGKMAGTEGSGAEFAMSQMLLAEGEDIYALMGKRQPTINAGYHQRGKTGPEENKVFWEETIPAEMEKLETLLKSTSGDNFTSSGTSVGELYLFAMLYQCKLLKSGFLDATPALLKFYNTVSALPGVAKVLAGKSSIGELKQYFVLPTN